MSDIATADNCHPDEDDLYYRHLDKLDRNGYGSCAASGKCPQNSLHHCKHCGSTELVPSGACHVCSTCGESTGCS